MIVFIVSLNAQLIHRVFSQRLTRTLPSVSVRGPPRRTYCLRDTASILFGLTTLKTESSWLKKKLPRMKLDDDKIVKGYEEAGREWSASS